MTLSDHDQKKAVERMRASIHVLNGLTDQIYQTAEPPYVSLYLPVHHADRAGGRDWWDDVELKDLVNQAKADLERDYEKRDVQGIEEFLAYLEKNPNWFVWEGARNAIAFLVSNTDVFVIPLDIDITWRGFVTVGEEFFIKPLIRNFEQGIHYFLLLVSADRFGLLEGDEETVNRVPVPHGTSDTLASEFADYDESEAARGYMYLEAHDGPYFGRTHDNSVHEEEAEKYFRYVCDVVNDTYKDGNPTPVIIVSLPEHLALIRKACTLHDVLDEAIEKDPGSMNAKELVEAATAIMEKHRNEDLAKVLDRFSRDAAHGKASSDVDEVAHAIFEDKVDILLVEKGKQVPGSYDASDGTVNFDDAKDPADSDLFDPASPDVLDSLAQAALKQGAEVVVLPSEKMPAKASVAAIYRY